MESALGVNLTKRMFLMTHHPMIRLLLNKLPSKDRVERERIFSFFSLFFGLKEWGIILDKWKLTI